MIHNFTEHSANERTFLAWLRTGIAVIGFGFVVEKFNLFILALTNTESVNRAVRTDRLAGPLGRYEGLALMGVGIVLIVVAGVRFVRTTRLLEAHAPRRAGVHTEVIITIVLVLLVAAYFLSIVVH